MISAYHEYVVCNVFILLSRGIYFCYVWCNHVLRIFLNGSRYSVVASSIFMCIMNLFFGLAFLFSEADHNK